MAIFAEITEKGCIIERQLRDIHPLLDDDASKSQSAHTISSKSAYQHYRALV